MKFIRFILTAIVLVKLTACSMVGLQPAKNEKMSVYFSEPNRIQFQGKGAGAGIALMSTMGPVGIALGVAIDEGIAKDIRKAIGEEKADIQGYLKTQTADLLSHKGYSVLFGEAVSKETTFPKIIIKRMGFKITNGSTDATSTEWELELHNGPDEKLTVNYPKNFDKDKVSTHVLADLKENGKLGIELLDDSLVLAIDALLIKANLKK